MVHCIVDEDGIVLSCCVCGNLKVCVECGLGKVNESRRIAGRRDGIAGLGGML